MINFKDGSTTAHIANANMQLPISYALLGRVDEQILPKVDLLKLKNLEFKEILTSRYPIWELKNELLNNDNLGVVLNSSNEVAVEAFLKGKIGFLDISKITINTINRFNNLKINSIEDIYIANEEVKQYTEELI